MTRNEKIEYLINDIIDTFEDDKASQEKYIKELKKASDNKINVLYDFIIKTNRRN